MYGNPAGTSQPPGENETRSVVTAMEDLMLTDSPPFVATRCAKIGNPRGGVMSTLLRDNADEGTPEVK